MTEDYKQQTQTQNILLEGRKKVVVSGVIDVECFDDNAITLITVLGTLLIKGNDMKIEKLHLEQGEVVATGSFYLAEYTSDDHEKGGFFSRMFK